MPSSSYAPLADEVNPPFSKSTPAPIVTRSGTITYQQEERDLGEMPRFSRLDKGKGKAKGWDVEQGQEQVETISSYPPISSEEEDERRIQAVCCAVVHLFLKADFLEPLPPGSSRPSGKESTLVASVYKSTTFKPGNTPERVVEWRSECLYP
jgi:hypothetical protein